MNENAQVSVNQNATLYFYKDGVSTEIDSHGTLLETIAIYS